MVIETKPGKRLPFCISKTVHFM